MFAFRSLVFAGLALVVAGVIKAEDFPLRFDHHSATLRHRAGINCAGGTRPDQELPSQNTATATFPIQAPFPCSDSSDGKTFSLNGKVTVTMPETITLSVDLSNPNGFGRATLPESAVAEVIFNGVSSHYLVRITAQISSCDVKKSEQLFPAGQPAFPLPVSLACDGLLNTPTSSLLRGDPVAILTKVSFELSRSALDDALDLEIRSVYNGLASADNGDKGQPPPTGSVAGPATTDTRFVAGEGPDIRGACRYRENGPLRISIPVSRYVGETCQTGTTERCQQGADLNTLADPAKLIANGVISATAKLRVTAWDVDSNARVGAGVAPELDRVTLNGMNVGPSGTIAHLSGFDQQFSVSEFEVPIEIVRFPQVDPEYLKGKEKETKAPAPASAPPLPALNILIIDIDTGNAASGKSLWCTSVEWASLSFGAMAPLMLVHGTNAQLDTWTFPFVEYPDSNGPRKSPVERLSERGIVFDHRINLVPNGSFEENATLLQAALEQQARTLGVKRVHLIAHSKGASDARLMLFNKDNVSEPFRVLSLYSIGTPSQGTILSDIAVAAEQVPTFLLNLFRNVDAAANGLTDAGFANRFLAPVGAAPVDPAREIQRIERMKEFNSQTPPYPPGVCRYAIAGNADANDDKKVDATEALGVFPPSLPAPLRGRFGNRVYQALGRVTSLEVVSHGFDPNTGYWRPTQANPTVSPEPEPNDLVSTAASTLYTRAFRPLSTPGEFQPKFSLADGTFKWNHSALKNAYVMDLILDKIRADFPLDSEDLPDGTPRPPPNCP